MCIRDSLSSLAERNMPTQAEINDLAFLMKLDLDGIVSVSYTHLLNFACPDSCRIQQTTALYFLCFTCAYNKRATIFFNAAS